jgi:hypothetical protein
MYSRTIIIYITQINTAIFRYIFGKSIIYFALNSISVSIIYSSTIISSPPFIVHPIKSYVGCSGSVGSAGLHCPNSVPKSTIAVSIMLSSLL